MTLGLGQVIFPVSILCFKYNNNNNSGNHYVILGKVLLGDGILIYSQKKYNTWWWEIFHLSVSSSLALCCCSVIEWCMRVQTFADPLISMLISGVMDVLIYWFSRPIVVIVG